MSAIDAVVTADARMFYAQFHAGLLGTPGAPTNTGTSVWDPRWKYIRWGTGGWVDPGTGPVRRAPSGSLRRLTSPLIQDIDAAVDTTRSVGDRRYPVQAVFQRELDYGTDVSDDGAGIARVRAFLDFTDFNTDGAGNPPRIWELGLFSDHPTVSGRLLMVAYATIPLVTKTVMIQVERYVRVRF